MIKKGVFIIFSVLISLGMFDSCSTLKKTFDEPDPAEKDVEVTKIKNSKTITLDEYLSGDKKSKKIKGSEIEISEGIVGLKIRPKLGTFNLGVKNDKGKFIPVTFSGNEYSTTGFYLKINKKIYKLIADSAVEVEVSKNSDSVKLVYRIIDQADIYVTFDFIKTVEDSDCNMVKVTAEVLNVSKKANTFALKSILDTVLGEAAGAHFYTKDMMPVNSEVMYKTMQKEKWFFSKNEKAAMEIFLDGLDITAPECVVLGNYSTLNAKNWIPEVTNLKTFDTLLSYNNSGLGIIWPEVKLESFGSSKFIFYMAFSNNAEVPFGEGYVHGIQKEPEIKQIILPQPATEKKINPVQVLMDEESEENIKRKVNVSNLSKNQLSPEYIQNLLNRIEALEDTGIDSVNKWELMQLNDELDAILDFLRHN